MNDNIMFYNNIARTARRAGVTYTRVRLPHHMSIARRSRGTCGHGMWTLGSQVVRFADNGVCVIVAGPSGCRRCMVRRPGCARWRQPARRWRVRALQQLRRRGISRRVSRPPYYQSDAGKSAGGGDDAPVRTLRGACKAPCRFVCTIVRLSCSYEITTRK